MVTTIKEFFTIGQIPKITEDTTDLSYRSMSEKDLQATLKEVYVEDSSRYTNVNKQQIPSMLEPIGRELIDRQMDHEKLLALAPEIEQAASILIPSLLSPQDFRKNVFNLIVEGGNESDETKTEIIKILNDHFDGTLDMSVRISEWVNDAMFRKGAKVVMVLPTSTISNLRQNISSMEALEANVKDLSDELTASLEHIACSTIKKEIYSDDDITDTILASNVFELPEMVMTETERTQRDADVRNIRAYIKRGFKSAMKHIDDKKSIVFTEDPRMLFQPKLTNSVALESINSNIMTKLGVNPKPKFRDRKDGIANNTDNNNGRYNYHPYIDLSEYIVNDDASSFPAMIELPTEAIIPIIIEGSPSNHIGYFIMLNENGSPISTVTDNYGDLLSSSSGSQRISNLYGAFYGNAQFSIQKKMAADAKVEILNSIYDGFVKNLMHSKLDELGLDKHQVEISSSVSQVMFTRLLKNTETRILFVPKKLITYLAFDYHPDGTGKSKIDSIKFPLSLKMTLIVTRLISLIESSINRRSMSLTLDESIGNPIELLRTIKKSIVNTKSFGLSYDPSTIIKSVLDKQLTLIPDRIPGVENFSISDNANNVEYPKPDDGLLDEINKMYTMTLGVPPSAMNRLGEDEFSRSVASNNIFFSNQLKTSQRVICATLTDFIQVYTEFSNTLCDSIKTILKQSESPGSSTEGTIEGEVDGSVEGKKELHSNIDEDLDARLFEIIRNIRYTLPSPNFAPDKASFEDLKEYIEIVDNVLMALYPDDMVIDSEIGGVVKVVRANMRRALIQAHIQSNSLLSDFNFDALSNIDVVSGIESTQKMMALKAALDGVVKAFTAGNEESGGAQSQW